MGQSTTQTATRSARTATPKRAPTALTTVAVMVGDSAARTRVVTALGEEGLVPLIVTARDISVRGLDGPPVAALVYDLAPWNDDARRLLGRLGPDLPVMFYAPSHAEVARLLIEAGRLPLVDGELQCDGPGDIARLRRSVRRLLEMAPAAIVFRLLMRHAPNLPSVVVQFCRNACGVLAAGMGDTLTVSHLASALGADRRTLERHWRAHKLPPPKEMLDWIIVVFAAYLSERDNLLLYSTHELLGMSWERLRRSRLRLRHLRQATQGVVVVLTQFARRLTRPNAQPPHHQPLLVPFHKASPERPPHRPRRSLRISRV